MTSGRQFTDTQVNPKTTMRIMHDDAAGVLKIAGTIDIGEAEQLRIALADCLVRESSPMVDLSEVELCDAAALQLFYSSRNTALHWNKPFRIAAISAAVAHAAEALGFPMQELMSGIHPGAPEHGRA